MFESKLKDKKQNRMKEELKHLAAEFIKNEANSSTSLITVTDVALNDKKTVVNIFFTVFPTTQEAAALDFINRQKSNFKEFLKSKSRMMRIPFFIFHIDEGEKNRQHIDTISNSIK